MDNYSEKLYTARCVRHLLSAADELEKACSELVAARNENLFKTIHEARMSLLKEASLLIRDNAH